MVNLNKDLGNKIIVNNVEIDLIKMRDDINKKIDYSTIFGIIGVLLTVFSFYLNFLVIAPINEFRVELSSFEDRIDKRFEQIDKRFEQIDRRFEQIDRRFDLMEQHWQESNQRTDQLYLQMMRATSK